MRTWFTRPAGRGPISVYLLLLAIFAAFVRPSFASAQTAPAESDVQYYHTDAIGTVRLVTDQVGAIVAYSDYAPFGTPYTATPSTDQPRGFAGKVRDSETGFDYFGGRYLLTGVNRFTTVDPVFNFEAATTDPQRWHRYTYALNNPVRLVDPDGREVPAAVNGKMFGMGMDGVPRASAREQNVVLAQFAGTVLGGGMAAGPATSCFFSPACGVAVMSIIEGVAPGPTAGLAAGALARMSTEATASRTVALGLRGGLQEFADRIGATTFLKAGDWQDKVLAAIADPNTKIIVRTADLEGGSVYGMVMKAITQLKSSAIGWELKELYQSGRIKDVIFMDDAGSVLKNPFH